MTTANSTGLLTQHELDRLIPSRTRQRWQKQGHLPRPARVFADRRELVLYPDFVLARVVVGISGPKAQERAVERAWKVGTDLFRSNAFVQVKLNLKRALRELPEAETPVLFSFVRETAPGVWREWQSCQSRARDRIRREGISLESKAARIRDVRDDHVLVEAEGMVYSLTTKSVAFHPQEGLPAGLERIRVFGQQRDFVLPVALFTLGGWKAAALDELTVSIAARISGHGRPFEDFTVLEDMSDAGVNAFHAEAMKALDTTVSIEEWQGWLDQELPRFVAEAPRSASASRKKASREPDVVAMRGPIRDLDWESLLTISR